MAALVETMVSANGVIPWHRQGKVLSGYPGLQEMYEASGLTWKVECKPVSYKDNAGNYIDVPDVYAITRDSDGKVLGTCTNRYTPYQNQEAFNWCKPLLDSKYWKMETAGSLKEGRVCWALLNQGTSKIMKGDNLKQFLLLQWGHTGCDSIRCGLTSIRVVCNNTLQQALRQDAATLHAVSHNKHTTVKLSEIRDMYDKVQEEFKNQEKIFKEFLDVPIDENTKSWYINELLDGITNLPDTAGKTEEEQEAQMKRYTAMRERKESLIRLYIEDGSGQKELGITNNLWGLFNGTEEFLEKCNGGGKVKDRGWNILRGDGASQVNLAFNLAMQKHDEYVTV